MVPCVSDSDVMFTVFSVVCIFDPFQEETRPVSRLECGYVADSVSGQRAADVSVQSGVVRNQQLPKN